MELDRVHWDCALVDWGWVMGDKVFNADPLSSAARSLFAQMILRIRMDEHERNMIVAATIGISDDDIANMIERSGLCQRKLHSMDEEPGDGVWVWTVKRHRFGSREGAMFLREWYDDEDFQLHGDADGWIPMPKEAK